MNFIHLSKKSLSLPLLFLLLLIGGCSDGLEGFLKDWVVAPPAAIERVVKGHDQVYYIQAILRVAHLKKENADNPKERRYMAYNNAGDRSTPIPLFQEIDLSKNAEGSMEITSEKKVFYVVKGKDLYYALELRYFDGNNRLINHQFTGFFKDDKDINNSTLRVHQHFFTIQNYGLRQTDAKGNILTGYLLTYPMTLDSVYYDRYLFKTNGEGGELIPSSTATPRHVFVPVKEYKTNTLRYDSHLAQVATEATYTAKASEVLEYKGTPYKLYSTIDGPKLAELTHEIFTYEYRDTDPIERELDAIQRDADDLGRTVERAQLGFKVIRLRKERALLPAADLDHMGFKGIMNFKHSDMTFQMRIALCHIQTTADPRGKYDGDNFGGVRNYDEMNPNWNSFDLDYPVPFRVIADADGDEEALVKDVQHFYPKAEKADIIAMLKGDGSYFREIPSITF